MSSDLRCAITIFWSSEDDCFPAEVPELPGCLTDGLTCELALANAQDAARAWIETARKIGRDVPEPAPRPHGS